MGPFTHGVEVTKGFDRGVVQGGGGGDREAHRAGNPRGITGGEKAKQTVCCLLGEAMMRHGAKSLAEVAAACEE
jgi:hypothetical protein